MSTSLRSSPDTRPIFLEPPSVDPLSLTTFVPGAILHAAELNGSFASVLPLTGGTITAPNGPIKSLTINTGDNGPACQNGLLVKQGYKGGGLGMKPTPTGWTGSFQFGDETYADHNDIVFATPNRPSGQYNNLESVLTIPASPGSSQLTNAFTASVHDYSGGGALAGIFYAMSSVNNSTLYAINTVCTDRHGTVPLTTPLTGIRQQIEFDYFASHTTTTVRGVMVGLSAVDTYHAGGPPYPPLTPLNASSWIGFETTLFPGSAPWTCSFSSGNGCAQTALLIGSTGPYGNPVETGDKSQTVQFGYTDNTTATTQRAIALYADPTFAGSIGADLRFDSSYAGPANITLDNLSYLKSVSADGTTSLSLVGMNGQNQMEIGGGAQTILVRGNNGGPAAIAQFNAVPNAINNVQFTGGVAGSPPIISSFHGQLGTDTNIGLVINPMGLGVLSLNALGTNTVIGSGAAIATNALYGHLQIPTCAGPPTGAVGGAGKAALIADSTNHKLYFNDGSGWLVVN